jgi:uncharacterized protein YcbK (DUF882 family)
MVTLRSRREVLGLAASVAALVGARDVFAARAPERKLKLYSVHTSEHLAVTYFRAGHYDVEALASVERLLRDHCSDETHAIDPLLLDQLHRLYKALGSRESFHVVCGYRSAETNARERLLRHGVAAHSLHIDGRAVDLFVPDRDLDDVRTAALQLGAGGVGYYPASGFVHLDTGPIRTW